MAQTRIQTSSYADDVRQQFNDDWQQAQSLYTDALNKGEDDTTADQVYLQPIRDKWKIIQASPDLMQDKDALNKFHTEYGTALDDFYQGINQNQEPIESAFNRHVRPVQSKYASGTRLPESPYPKTAGSKKAWYADSSAMEDEDAEAQYQIEQGQNPQDVLQAHPTLLNNEPYRAKWLPIFKTAENRSVSARAKSNAPIDILKLGKERADYQKLISEDANMPAPLKDMLDAKVSGLEQSMTNAPTAISGRVRFQPPAEVQGENAPESGGSSAKFNSAAEVKAAYRAGQIDKKSAMQILQDQFGMQ